MNKVSFDLSSKLSLKRDPDSRHEPNPSYYWNSSRKKQEKLYFSADSFSTLFLVETTLHENNWITKQHNSSTGI